MTQETNDRGALESQDQEDKVFSEEFEKAASVDKKEEPPAKPAEQPPPAAATPAQDAPPPPDEAETAEQRYRTLKGIHQHDKETWNAEKAAMLAEKAALAAQLEDAKKAKEPPKKEPVPDLDEGLTDEQKQLLKDYETEFDQIAKMEGLKREKAIARLEKKYDDMIAKLESKIAPVTETIKSVEEREEVRQKGEHFSAIKDAHPDFTKYRDDGSIMNWIKTKPKYLQQSMIETYSKGIAEDVVDLITDFKNENNIPITEQPKAEADDKVVPISSSARKEEKRLAMTAVTTRRGAVNTKLPATDDFDSAFDEAIRTKGG